MLNIFCIITLPETKIKIKQANDFIIRIMTKKTRIEPIKKRKGTANFVCLGNKMFGLFGYAEHSLDLGKMGA